MSSPLVLGWAGWGAVALCGGFLALDATSWPQSMVSRPLVSATVGGALLGDPSAGLLVGAVLELITLRHMPFGASRSPDTGPAGLVAGGACATAGPAGSTVATGGSAGAALPAGVATEGLGLAGTGGDALSLFVAVAAGWALAWLGTLATTRLRRLNDRLFRPELRSELAARPARIERRHRVAIGLDFLRGAVLASVFLVPASLAVRSGPLLEPALPGAVASLWLALAAGTGAGAAAAEAGGGRGRLLAGGLAAGALLVLVGGSP